VAWVVVVGAFMTQLDGAVVNIGLATIANDLHAPLTAAQWTVSGYLLALVAGLPLCGWTAARYGPGRLWLAALTGFTVASALCALAPTLPLLVAARVLQGFAGGLLLPAGQTVIAQVAGRRLMGRVMSTVGMSLVLGPAIGPTLGGFLIAHASWPWLFLINLPVGAVGLWLGWRIIPRAGGAGAGTGFDGIGFVLIGVGLLAVTYVVSQAGTDLTWLVVGLLALAAFVWRGLATDAPLLKLRQFGNPVFAAAAAASFCAGALQFGALVIWALYFQLARGYGLVGSGWAMIGFAAGAAMLPIAGRLTDRFSGGPVTLAGTVLTTAVLVPVALAPADTPLLLLEAGLFLFGVANALSVVPASTAAYVTVAPPDLPDAVTQINILLRLGGAVGAALVVAVLGDQDQPRAELLAGFHGAFSCLAVLAVVSIASALYLVRAAGRSVKAADVNEDTHMIKIVSHTATSSAPASAFYQRWIDHESWSTWSPDTEWVRLSGPVEKGAQGTLKPTGGPKVKFVIKELVADREYTDTNYLPGARLIFQHTAKPADGRTELGVRVRVWLSWSELIMRRVRDQLDGCAGVLG
jgi:EmrB/QacA subfamily drug resistance transporter